MYSCPIGATGFTGLTALTGLTGGTGLTGWTALTRGVPVGFLRSTQAMHSRVARRADRTRDAEGLP
ncbi:MAG TPA: hypothetical protein DEV93_14580 [Chloroflexi bacterium]|nr:hypothetical protein [Chloroflexota bacterium]